MTTYWVLLSILGLLSCNQPSDNLDSLAVTQEITHAQGFDIIWVDGIKIVVLKSPWKGASQEVRYALLPAGQSLPDHLTVDQVITTPVNRMVVTSTTHLPALDLLDAHETLIGFPQTQYITTPGFVDAVTKGTLLELGSANGLNLELLLQSKPDLVMTYQSGGDFSQLDALKASNIPTVLNADFLEPTPLGRAEWIKFIGHLIGREQQADSVFQLITANYNQVKELTRKAHQQPTVFSGSMYGGTWYAPGGKSFVAHFVTDAGGHYTWSHEQVPGSLELSFEAVLENDQNTQYWIGLGGFRSLADIINADQRYENFEAYNQGQVYNYNKRVGQNGGYEYLEMGVARPDIVLKDLVKILHPQLLPDYETYFFQKLP